MNKSFLVIICMITLSVFANAKSPSVTEAEATKMYNQKVGALDEALGKSENQFKTLSLSVEKLETDVAKEVPEIEKEIAKLNDSNDSYEVTGGWFGSKTAKMKSDVEKRIQALSARKTKIQDDLYELRQERLRASNEYDKAKEDYDYYQKQAKYDLDQASKRITSLEKDIARMRVTDKFTSLDSNIKSIDDKIDALNRVYDQTLMGVYIKDKFAQFINSDVACEMNKRCQEGGKDISPSKIEEIFKNAPEKSTRSERRKSGSSVK